MKTSRCCCCNHNPAPPPPDPTGELIAGLMFMTIIAVTVGLVVFSVICQIAGVGQA